MQLGKIFKTQASISVLFCNFNTFMAAITPNYQEAPTSHD